MRCPRGKSCSRSSVCSGNSLYVKRDRSDTEEIAWTQASDTAFSSAKQNRFSLVCHMVGRIVSLETESEPSLFHVAEITDTRFSTTFQHPDCLKKKTTNELSWEVFSVIITALGTCSI